MKQTIILSATAFVLLTQPLAAVQLDPITVVSATKEKQTLAEITSDITIITAEELEEKHITTVKDAINLANGIAVTQNGARGQLVSFYLRGMSTAHTLVLLDGVKLNDPSVSQAQIETMVLTNIDRIEILQGAQSGVWGADAAAGVINIITKSSKEAKSSINLELGEQNTKQLGLSFSDQFENLSYQVGIQQVTTDGISAHMPVLSDADQYEDDDIFSRTMFGKVAWQISENHALKLQLQKVDHNTDYDKAVYNTTTFLTEAQPDSAGRITSDYQRHQLTYNFDQESHHTEVYLNQSRFEKEDPLGFTPKYEAKIKEYGIRYTRDYAARSFVTVGASSQKSEDEIKESSFTDKAVFVTNSTLLHQWVVTQSLRFDSYDAFADKVTGKLGVKYNFAKDTNLFTNLGTGYKAPSMYDLSVATSELKPESSQTFDIGVNFQGFKVVYFNNKITDLIDYNFDPVTSSAASFNSNGESTFKGVEVSYQRVIGEHYFASLGYSWLNAKDQNGDTFANRPKEKVTASLDYDLEQYQWNLNAVHIGDREGVMFSNYYQRVDTGNYTLVNSVFNYAYSERVQVYLKVDNLFDTAYREVDGYGTLGRTFYVGTTVNF